MHVNTIILFFQSNVLIHLIFRNQVINIALGLCKLHIIHSFLGVIVEEGLSAEHSRELIRYSLEDFLNRSGISDKSGRHIHSLGRGVANRRFDIVRDPFDEVAGIFVLEIEEVVINLLSRNLSSKHSASCQIFPASRIASRHHIVRVEHLLRELCHRR